MYADNAVCLGCRSEYMQASGACVTFAMFAAAS